VVLLSPFDLGSYLHRRQDLKPNGNGGPSSGRTISVTTAMEFVQVKEATIFG
jgi:hypothetical protein